MQNTPYRSYLWLTSLALLCCLAAPGAARAGGSQEQMRSLDEQVQETKSDVLDIAAELSRLEERLIYPSNTQVSVFVEMAGDDPFVLDSVEIQIDGQPVATHIYTFKELEALQKGGVQRLYTGNVPTGSHRLDVAVTGKRSGGGDVTGAQTFSFEKGVEPRLVGVTLAGDADIQLGSW